LFKEDLSDECKENFEVMPQKEKTALNGIKEIARQARVSIATVDRVIHNRTGVSEKTKEKIKTIIGALNYQPNIFARQLASRKDIEFALLLPAVSKETSYWQAPLDGVLQAEKEIHPLGISVIKYFFDQNESASFIRQARAIIKKQPAGVLLAPVFIPEAIKFIAACYTAGIPYVFIDADIPGQKRLSYIGPDLFQSGRVAGHLIRYGVAATAKVLVMNISKDLHFQNGAASTHRLLRKEAGLRFYFAENNLNNPIITVNLRQSDYASVAKSIEAVFAEHPNVEAICVTNSRVSTIARWLEDRQFRQVFLVGFDFTETNIEYLKKDIIDFVICDKPQEQGYRGMMLLYQKIVLALDVDDVYYMPIDIVTKENCSFYRN
jgi:LacI family transcriptional regulator